MILEIILLGIGLIIMLTLMLIGWAISTYNYLQTAKQEIQNMWSNIKTEYQRRYDLFLNLARTVKSYKEHEKNTLTQVIKARSQLNFVGTQTKQLQKMGELDKLFSKLAVVFEKYPNLKANEQHNNLMTEIRISEDRINVARTSYNDTVNLYNTRINTFPGSIIASWFGFKNSEYYINEAISDKTPKIEL